PTAFATKEGERGTLITLKREKEDAETIQGTWTVVSRESIGKKTPEAELKRLKVTIKDGTLTIDDGKKKEKHTYNLDPSKKPKAIDLANTGIESKETTLAIYELDGDDLKICWSEKDPEHRATKFASDEDSGQSMIVLNQKKKNKVMAIWPFIGFW
ncbi:MAG TPA: TIGR03067 domain-containing protein, partial [Gemmataceae bacterium]|nr:TIGR03067 domain-containing protein [Gemmataceae bacterium]